MFIVEDSWTFTTMTSPSITWESLLKGIREAFSEDRVNVDEVKRILNSYVSNRSDWKKYEHFNRHKYVFVVRAFIDEWSLFYFCSYIND